jgi:quercetin dioxygenase-like cupin family protein
MRLAAALAASLLLQAAPAPAPPPPAEVPRLLALSQARWEALVPGAPSGPEVARVREGAPGAPSQTLLRLPKGAALPAGVHAAEATLVLLEGEMAIEAAGKAFELRVGSVLTLPAGVAYRGRTRWDRPALALVTLAGPWSRATP